jgi:predicted MPP superfamily phosphohydrolase
MTSTAATALLMAHVPVALTAAWVIWRWRLRLQRGVTPGRWLLAAVGDGAAIVTALVLGLAILGVRAGLGFLTMRFGAQALFGEILLTLAVVSALHFRIRPEDGRLPIRRGALLAVTALCLLGVYAEAYHRGPYDLQIRRHDADITRGEPAAGTLRVLHLTDLQTHAIRAYERGVFAKAAALEPDLIVFTGDYLQSRSRPNQREGGDDFRAMIREAGFRPRYGFYAVQGDCEDNSWASLFEGLEVTCLSNESRVIRLAGGKRLVLTGLDLRTSRFGEATKVRKALAAAPAGDRRLVIGHAPDFVAKVAQPSGIDLALAGHTHGGQIVIPGFGPPVTFSRLPRRYAGGMNQYGDMLLHVSRGIGMERGLAPQVRFMCPPEICLIELRY